MRPSLIILSLYFFACGNQESADTPLAKKPTTDTLGSQVEYDSLRNGLYINSTGDIGIRTFEKIGDDTLLEAYITRVHTGKEEGDGGPQYLKNVVDTATFEDLGEGYFKDKTNAYFLFSTTDGGALKIIPNAEPKSFRSFGKNELASDKASFYQHGEKISRQAFQKYIGDTLGKESNSLKH